jgi:excisionase family DNA binding protein
MSAAPLPAGPEHRVDRLVWTLEELLERLPVSRSTIYRWIEREGLPVVRIGESSRPLFLPQSVLGWIQSRERKKPARPQAPRTAEFAFNTVPLAGLRQMSHGPRPRRTPPPPIATAGTRDRLRRIHGAR